MARKTTVKRCKRCGKDIDIQSEGEYENPDGTYTSWVRFIDVERSECPFCTGRIKNGKKLL